MSDVAVRVARLWRAALTEEAGAAPDGSFFEVGGYSLLALALTEQLGREFGRELPRDLIFEHPYLDDLIRAIETMEVRPGPSAALAESPVGQSDGTAPLTDLQQAYWLGESEDFDLRGPAVFYEEYECRAFDVAQFQSAVDRLVERQGSLRTGFPDCDVQVEHPRGPATSVEWRSVAGCPAAERESVLAASRQELIASPPPLTKASVIRFRVFDVESAYRVQVCGRLLVFDGLSGNIFADELRALLRGERLAPLAYSYQDYRREHERLSSTPEYDRARAYWLERVDTLPPAPALPGRRRDRDVDERSRQRSPAAARLRRRTMTLEAAHWDAIQGVARTHGVTPTAALCAAFCEVLRNWARNPAFSLNVMFGERRDFHPDVRMLVGNFSSTLLLAYDAEPGTSFAARAARLQRQLGRDMAHGLFTGVEVIRELNRRAANVQGAAMPVVLATALDAGGAEGVFLERLGWRRVHGTVQTPQVSFDHQVFVSAGRLILHWDTDDTRFEAGVIDAMFESYRILLNQLGRPRAWSQQRVDLTPATQLAVREKVNATDLPVPPQVLHAGFDRQALLHPDRPAVDGPDGVVSYDELRTAALRVAGFLHGEGHRPGQLVGIVTQPGWRQVAALLGVLYAGGAYVPLGADWPPARRLRIAERAALQWVLTSCPVTELTGSDRRVLPLTAALAPAHLLERAQVEIDPESLAYVIFTSGTTGEPKGVAIRHQSAVNTIVDLVRRCSITEHDRVLAVSDVTFDLSVFDLFGLLTAGGAIVLPPPGERADPAVLHAAAVRGAVTIWNSVPAYFSLLAEHCRQHAAPVPTLRVVLLSGDWVPLTVSAELRAVAPHATCLSLGGATEASIWSNCFEVPPTVPPDWPSIPYGFPLANQRYRVLDTEFRDRPDWVAGELHIEGRGLADGYLNDAVMTARAFKTHPVEGGRLYATGDWGRYWPDGTLEFLGREDPQVKVNGFRVELAEVESCLLSHPDVAEAVVTLQRGAHGAWLAGHVVLHPEARASGADLRAHVGRQLPGYEVPAQILPHDSLPLTANGKVDRPALAARAQPTTPVRSAAGRALGTALEGEVAEVWRDVLGAVDVDATSDFFDLGGTSIAAARLLSRLEQRFGRRLPLTGLYEHRTVAGMAGLLKVTPSVVPSALVHLDGERDQHPVVFVHPVGGDVLCYRELLPHLPPDVCSWGLRARGARRDEDSGAGLHELADAYLTALAPAVDAGPVRLAGWSFGAIVAYEMARRLAGSGRVAGVVLLDPWVAGTDGLPGPGVVVSAFFFDFSGGELVLDLGTGIGDDADELLRLAWQVARDRRPELWALPWGHVQTMFSVYREHSLALSRYQPSPPPDGVRPVVVQAAQPLVAGRHLRPFRAAMEQLGVARRFDWVTLPGDHFAVVSPRHAARVAALIAGAAP